MITEPQSAGKEISANLAKTRREWWIRLLVGPLLLLGTGVLLIAILGLAQRVGWIVTGGTEQRADVGADSEVTFVCPMHPQIRQPIPGRCPICGMPLEPTKTQESNWMGVKIDPAARRVANIQTVEAKPIALSRAIRAVGSIDYDESQLATIAAYVDGRIETLFGDYTGVRIKKGSDMARLYSPQLYAAQSEFLQSHQMLLDAQRQGFDRLVATQRDLGQAARRKLVELGMTKQQIADLQERGVAETRITIRAPIDGTVIDKKVVEGQYVKAGDVIYRIANLSVIWLKLQLFPEDVPYIRYGQQVVAESDSLPGRSFQGRVAFIDPMVNEKTRTVGVRVVMSNPEGGLRVGDYATAEIEVPIGEHGQVYDDALAGKYISPRHPQIVAEAPGVCPICGIDLVPTDEFGFAKQPVPRRAALVVPRSAVLKVGDTSVVYVESKSKAGYFEIRYVELGPLTSEYAVILSGVEDGDAVATSGNFLIDSQMQLAGNPSLIDPERAKKAQHQHPSDQALDIPDVALRHYSGETGEGLELLYEAYLAIQARLAADETPASEQFDAIHSAAEMLLAQEDLTPEAHALIQVIVKHAVARPQDLSEARGQFKPISHATIRLAAQARGEEAAKQLVHFFCPMVKGGGGDWLQATSPLANPYWGSEMLRCGTKQRALPFNSSGPLQPRSEPRVERGDKQRMEE